VKKLILLILLYLQVFTLWSIPATQNDSILNVAKDYLKKSQPDNAIPLLLDIINNYQTKSIAIEANIHLADAYRQKREYKKGLELLNFIIKENNLPTASLTFAYNRMAAIYNEWGSDEISCTDSAIFYSERCISILEINEDKNLLATSQNELAYAFRIKKNYTKSLEYCEKAYNNFIDLGLYDNAINVAINWSGLYIDIKKFDKALEINEQAFKLSSEDENKNLYMRLYLNKAHVYEALKNYKGAFEAIYKARQLQKDFYDDRIKLQINEMSAKYDLQIKEYQIKNIEAKQRLSDQQKMYLTIILVIIMITFTVSMFTVNLRQKNKRQQAKLVARENDWLKYQLELKEKEILYKSKELSEAISSKISLNETLKSIKSVLDPVSNHQAIEIINNNLSKNLSWEYFQISFNEIYPLFFKQIDEKFPTLTKHEITICAFLVMGMTTSKIADLMNITEPSVSKNRNRLRKKLNLENGADISEFLKTLL